MHVENEQVAPCAQASWQPPDEQATVHVAPLGHDVLQWPLEQSTVHVPSPQYVRQCPLEQSSVQSPVGGQMSSQLPAEQSAVQGVEVQAALQLPEEHEHVPLGHVVLERGAPVPGSETGGPPFGVLPPSFELPLPTVLLEPPQAVIQRNEKAKNAARLRKMDLSFRRIVPRRLSEQAGQRPRSSYEPTSVRFGSKLGGMSPSAASAWLGVTAAEGLAVGRATRLSAGPRASSIRVGALGAAIVVVRRDLEQLVGALPRQEAELFEPEILILDDIAPALRAREAAGETAEAAIFAETSCGCTDLVIDLRERLLAAVSGTDTVGAAPATGPGDELVLLAPVVTPSLVAFLPKQVVAVVGALDEREQAGTHGHTAILARGRGVPVVYVAHAALRSIPDEVRIAVDASGTEARVWVDPDDSTLGELAGRRERQRLDSLERASLDHLGIALRVNVSSAHDDIPPAAEGVGLVRTELMFAGSEGAPPEEQQVAALRRIAAKARGAPVVVRLFDAGGDKPLGWLGGQWGSSRGIARLLSYRDVLETQLRAIARAREHGDIRMLLPHVRSRDEVDAVRALAASSLPLGAMIESPDAVERAAEIASAADFVSIGTNDLTASALELDRSVTLPEADPRVLSLVRRAIEVAHAHGRQVTICGEMAGTERGACIAVALGADAISVAPARAGALRAALSRTTLEACRAAAG